ERWSAGRLGSPITLGRCTPYPAKALKLVSWLIANGNPDCRESTPATCQPLVKCPATPERCTGRLQVALAQRTFGMSPVEESRSRRRWKLLATGKFAIGPVRMEASNTDEASSISLECV